MLKHKTFIICVAIIFGVMLFLSFSSAQVLNPQGLQNVTQGISSTSGGAGLGSGPKNIPQLVINVVRIFLALVGTIFLVLIIWGGFRWMTAGGNDQKVTEARKIIINAVIGLAIISAAYAISTFIAMALEPPAANPPTQNP